MTRALDRGGQAALEERRYSSRPAREQFAALRHKLAEQALVAIIDFVQLQIGETASAALATHASSTITLFTVLLLAVIAATSATIPISFTSAMIFSH
jgi:hypothetical protein